MSEKQTSGNGRNGGAGWLSWSLGNRSSECACRWALMPVRLVLGVMFAYAGAQKAFGWFGGGGFEATVTMVRESVGLPAPVLFAVLLIIAELVGGVLLIVGVAPRLGALGFIIAMTVALCTVKAGKPYAETYLQQLILAASATIMIAGAGPLSVMRSRPKSP